MIGRYLTDKLLKNNHKVGWLSRSEKDNDHEDVRIFNWDIEIKEGDTEAVEWCDQIIHLAGAGVADKRWSDQRKKMILESRTKSATFLQELITKADSKPECVISASAVGYYGFKTSDEVLDEQSEPGDDFLAQVTEKWELMTRSFSDLNVRSAQIRIGIVLSNEGGAMVEMLKPPVLAPLGSGKQWMPWIHIEDLASIFMHCLANKNVKGPYNAVAPDQVTNKEFTELLARASGKTYSGIKVPAFALKAMVGEMAGMLLNGTRISNKKIKDSGFEFQYKDLKSALNQLFQTKIE